MGEGGGFNNPPHPVVCFSPYWHALRYCLCLPLVTLACEAVESGRRPGCRLSYYTRLQASLLSYGTRLQRLRAMCKLLSLRRLTCLCRKRKRKQGKGSGLLAGTGPRALGVLPARMPPSSLPSSLWSDLRHLLFD